MIDAEVALRHLRRADPMMADVIARVGPFDDWGSDRLSHFAAVARAIVSQQLSGKAAATIHGRFAATVGRVTPPRVAATPLEALRASGLSEAKARAVHDLAAKSLAGDIPMGRLHHLADDAVIAALTQARGVGVWTAQMFLMFRLRRPDVLPTGDLGIQKGAQRAYGLRRRPDPAKLTALAEPWRPWRTVACWYLWRLLDLP